MRLNPLDIQHREFDRSLLTGYNRAQVREFLHRLAEQLEDLEQQNKRLRDELENKSTVIDDLRTGEVELKRTVVAAERIGNEMKHSAKREAQLIMKDAEQRRDSILREAQQRYKEICTDVARLERERDLFREQFRGMLRAYERNLDAGNADTKPKAELKRPAPQSVSKTQTAKTSGTNADAPVNLPTPTK